MKNYFYILLMALMPLFSCTDDNSVLDDTEILGEPIPLIAGTDIASKVVGGDWNVWEGGEEVRITYKRDDEVLTNFPFSDRVYIYTADSPGLNTTLSTTGTPISSGFITGGASSMQVFAYSANDFPQFDIIHNNEYYHIDLAKTSLLGIITNPIYAISTRNKTDLDTDPIEFTFHHALAQVNVTFLNFPTGKVPDDLELWLTGTKTLAVNSWRPTSTVKMDSYASASSSVFGNEIKFQDRRGVLDGNGNFYAYEFEAEVAVQKIDAGGAAIIKIVDPNGKTYNYQFKDNFDFEMDHRYNVTISFDNSTAIAAIEAEQFVDGYFVSSKPENTYIDENGDTVYYINPGSPALNK